MSSYFVDKASKDKDGFFTHLPGWVVYSTIGYGTPSHPWALHYSPDVESAQSYCRVLLQQCVTQELSRVEKNEV